MSAMFEGGYRVKDGKIQEEKQGIAHWFTLYCKRNKVTKPTKEIVDDFISEYSLKIDRDYLMKVKL